MEYFKYELLQKINSPCLNDCKQAEDEWNKNDASYAEYFQTIRPLFSPAFLEKWDRYAGFHDFQVVRMYLEGQNVGMHLKKGNTQLILWFQQCNANTVDLFKCCGTVLYIELFYNIGIEVNILFSSSDEIRLCCSDISIEDSVSAD